MEQQQQQLQHFSHPEHPLVFNQDYRRRYTCQGCREVFYGPRYSCKECGPWETVHHKSCAELPLGLHHPLHPIHPLILFSPGLSHKCELCKEYKGVYAYRCSRCDFNLHITCASLAPTMDAEFHHHHPLTPFWKWITFTCDLCGKEDKGTPYLCHLCDFWIHGRCSTFPQRVKIWRHEHLLHLIHSSLEFHQSNSRFCRICVEKLDTHCGLYYCSRCDYVAHLDCCMRFRSIVDVNLPEFRDDDEVPELNESRAYQVKKSKVGVDGTQIDTEIKHFSHEHDLKLTDEVLNDQKCNGCARALLGPFYGCSQCGFFLHKSCANLPKTMRNSLFPDPFTLIPRKLGDIFQCFACERGCNGFSYNWKKFLDLDVQCALTLASDILTHKGHEHQLILSTTEYQQTCTSCNSKRDFIFRCTICEFALDVKCATLPYTIRYKQHEHPFTLCYTVEDDSNEYYCDICEEERDPKHWFYYCENCTYPAHPNCIIGKYTNILFWR